MRNEGLEGRRVLVTLPVTDQDKAEFSQLVVGAGGEVSFVREPEVTEADVEGISVIIGNVPASALHAPRELVWLQTSSAGYDHYLRPGVLAPETMLTNATGAYGQAVSEHMLAQTLCLMKKLHLYRDNQHDHAWLDRGGVTSPVGARVLVIGAGDIGRAYGRLMAAFGADVTGIRRSQGLCPEGFSHMATMGELFELLPGMDVVACALPSDPHTRGLVDKRFLDACKPGAILVNGGRGDLVVSDDLVGALESGLLGGAALDVTSPEPLPANHPLWACENALVTPHVAGFWHLPATTRAVIGICRSNLDAYVSGRPLCNVVCR